MAKSLRSLLTRNLQSSALFTPTSLWPRCSAANSITCCASFEVSAYATSLSPVWSPLPAQNLLCSLTSHRFNLLSAAWHHCRNARWNGREMKENPRIWEIPFYLLSIPAVQEIQVSLAFSCSCVTSCGASPALCTFILCKSVFCKREDAQVKWNNSCFKTFIVKFLRTSVN